MAGNFRGVLIFIIFMVDLAVTKFSHPRKLMPTLCESLMMGVATNIVAARPTLSSIASNSTHCHPADRSSILNILLSHAFCPSLCRYGSVTKKIVSTCID